MTIASEKRVIDLSHPLSAATPAFPGDPPPKIDVFDSTDAPSIAGERHMNCSHLAMSLHCGTHMDAPFHFIHDGVTIDRVPLARCMGPTALVRLPYTTAGLVIDVEQVRPHEAALRATGRVVFNTAWHHRWRKENYFAEHPVITGAAARWMLERGVLLFGVDTPSVDRAPYEAHLAILGSGALIVENLTNLDAIPGDTFHLIATPLAIQGRDGSPVRAVAVV